MQFLKKKCITTNAPQCCLIDGADWFILPYSLTSDGAQWMECEGSLFASLMLKVQLRGLGADQRKPIQRMYYIKTRVQLRYMDIPFTCEACLCTRGRKGGWFGKSYHLKSWDFKSSCRYGVENLPRRACKHIRDVHVCQLLRSFLQVYTDLRVKYFNAAVNCWVWSRTNKALEHRYIRFNWKKAQLWECILIVFS